MNTTDLHAAENQKVFHIPAMFGDDFAYTFAQETFDYIDQFSKQIKLKSKERFGIQMQIVYSTVDEYLAQIRKDSYPTYQGDFFPLT